MRRDGSCRCRERTHKQNTRDEPLASRRVDLGALVTHNYKLDDIVAAYDLFANQRDGVLKVAIKPH